jgi:hypothetical protein
MSIFENSFFTLEGQKERLANVKNTLVAAVTGKGVQSNTGNATVDKVLSAAASNPLTTAALITPVNTLSAAKAGFSARSSGAKVAVVAASPVVLGAAIANPKIVSKAAQTPANLAQFGSNIGEFSANPTWAGAKQIAQDNPVITGATVLGGGLVIGKGAAGILSTAANTAAVRANTNVSSDWTKTLENATTSGFVSSPGNVAQSATNKYDVELAKLNAKTSLKLAALQAETEQLQAQTYASPVAAPVATPVATPATATATKKKTTKKKATKKKATKKKTTKKKATKKKTTKKKTTKKKR